MMATRTILIFIVFIFICGPIHSDDVSIEQVQNKIIEVEKLINKAKQANGLWRDTDEIKSHAITLLERNKPEEALVLLELAEQQAILGYQQANSQTELNQLVPFYLKSDL